MEIRIRKYLGLEIGIENEDEGKTNGTENVMKMFLSVDEDHYNNEMGFLGSILRIEFSFCIPLSIETTSRIPFKILFFSFVRPFPTISSLIIPIKFWWILGLTSFCWTHFNQNSSYKFSRHWNSERGANKKAIN